MHLPDACALRGKGNNNSQQSRARGLRVWIGLLILAFASASVSAKTVSNPNHKGWSGKYPKLATVKWQPVEVKCERCQAIAEQYNLTVQELLNTRHAIESIRGKQRLWNKKNRSKSKKEKGDITAAESKKIAEKMASAERDNEQLAHLAKQQLMLEQQAQYLRQALIDCELQACRLKKPSKYKAVKIGGERVKGSWQPIISDVLSTHGIDWAGPYTSKCLPCLSVVEQLNALPGWVVRADMQLQRAKSAATFFEMSKDRFSANADRGNSPDVQSAQAALTQLKELFKKLRKDLIQCQRKYCPSMKDKQAGVVAASEGLIATNCPKPAAHEPITVGANNEVGSRANFKEKAKNKAAGLAAKAITGLLGIGAGGGGDSGPVTYKDPVKKKHKLRVRNKAEKRDMRTGGVFTPNGLLISSELSKAPGKGTFHTIYLENQRGWRLMPIGLYMYEIWQNWKLNVSWTRDTYVDGELVKHEEGAWSESWRVLVDSGEEVIYGEVPIWEQLGFNTAVSGARSLGTLFPVTPEMLAYEPINLVIHVTDPKKDPVVTVPYVFRLSLGKRGKIVVEQVNQTSASEGKPCNEPAPVIAVEQGQDKPLININDGNGVFQPPAPPVCPEGWSCMDGKQCPPIDNCTINEDDIEEIIVTGSRIRRIEDPAIPSDTTPPTSNAPESTNTPNDEIEDIVVTGSRIRTVPNDDPVQITPEDLGLDQNGGSSTDTTDVELEEVEVTGSPSTTASGYELEAGLKWDYGTKVRLGYEYQFEDSDDEDPRDTPPPTIFGEEEDPPVVGIALKSFDLRWIPRYQNYTFVYSKMYVPAASGNRWVPHPSVSRKMKITFVGRSNEKGMAMNKDLPSGPQDSPDLYFDPARNLGVDCTDDPTGNGHFGTCETKSEHNEYMWAINSDDYGAFSRLDVSCEGCVQLDTVAGLFPESFTTRQRWEVAVAEPNQERRAVYVPHDVNKNQIADGYPPDQVSSPSADQDNESTPAGNGVDGDGLSAYEEYRGFIDLNDLHKRTDWDKKTLLIENSNRLDINQFGDAAGLDVIPLEITGHRNRIVNFNSGHANVVDQHGLKLQMYPSLNNKYAGYCFCDLERPKGAERVTVKPKYRKSNTVAHELGHAVGMEHHGNPILPAWDANIRPMTNTWRDLMPGRVHSGPSLCGVALPASFTIGSKGDQGSGNHQCFMKYGHYHYAYKQAAGDYDCMPSTPRSIFDDSANGTGPNGGNRTADDASNGNCKSQIWINSK